MDKVEALEILDQELSNYQAMKYAELKNLIDRTIIFQRRGSSGIVYQVEVIAVWDRPGEPDGAIRVIASIDDGKFPYAFVPLSHDFIKTKVADT